MQELLRAEQSMEAGLWDKGGNIMRAGCRGLSKLQAKEGNCNSLLEDLQALEARCAHLLEQHRALLTILMMMLQSFRYVSLSKDRIL